MARNSAGILSVPPPSRVINFGNARRALYNNYNVQLRNKLEEIRREMSRGNLKMQS